MEKTELPQYKSHKTVQAAKIKEVIVKAESEGWKKFGVLVLDLPEEPRQQVSASYLNKHEPQAGGYYVRYPDGYESWSPAAAFEEGYSRVQAEVDFKMYYMRDNHTFRGLPEGEEMDAITEEFDAGWTGGHLFGHINGKDCALTVQAHGSEKREEFLQEAANWLVMMKELKEQYQEA